MTAFQMYTTEQKREHLLKLAEFLEQPSFEDRHGVRFDMVAWANRVVPCLDNPNAIVCGTAACMTGYATIALSIPRYKNVETWDGYCYRVLLPNVSPNQIWTCMEFKWLFDADWGSDNVLGKYETPDNTPQGGAARIRYYLANGVPDDDQVYAEKQDFSKKKYMELINPYHVDHRKSS